jgi:hypothetical protein
MYNRDEEFKKLRKRHENNSFGTAQQAEEPKEIKDEYFCPWAGNIDGCYFIGLTRQSYERALLQISEKS